MPSIKDDAVAGALGDELKLIPGLKLKLDESLARYTSMKIGGPADYLLQVEHGTALGEALRVLKRYGVAFCLLGKGSNVLVSDLGVRGAVFRLGEEFKRLEWREAHDGASVTVGASFAVTQLVRQAVRKGYSGLEFAEGIPGTVGGALVMNAGAYGSEMEKIVEGIEGVTAAGESVAFERQDLFFSYRDTRLPPGTVVTRVRFRLVRGSTDEMGKRLGELVSRRKTSQPSGYPNSGSMFRNPPGDFAGRLIEAAGLKGKKIGAAEISARHANFIVNLGGAKAAEVRQLMEMARAEVKKQFGIELVSEVRLLGDWQEPALNA